MKLSKREMGKKQQREKEIDVNNRQMYRKGNNYVKEQKSIQRKFQIIHIKKMESKKKERERTVTTTWQKTFLNEETKY